MRHVVLILFVVLSYFSMNVMAESGDNLQREIQQLQHQTRQLQAQLDHLQRQLVKQNEVSKPKLSLKRAVKQPKLQQKITVIPNKKAPVIGG